MKRQIEASVIGKGLRLLFGHKHLLCRGGESLAEGRKPVGSERGNPASLKTGSSGCPTGAAGRKRKMGTGAPDPVPNSSAAQLSGERLAVSLPLEPHSVRSVPLQLCSWALRTLPLSPPLSPPPGSTGSHTCGRPGHRYRQPFCCSPEASMSTGRFLRPRCEWPRSSGCSCRDAVWCTPLQAPTCCQ